jgi:hypothetical protein
MSSSPSATSLERTKSRCTVSKRHVAIIVWLRAAAAFAEPSCTLPALSSLFFSPLRAVRVRSVYSFFLSFLRSLAGSLSLLLSCVFPFARRLTRLLRTSRLFRSSRSSRVDWLPAPPCPVHASRLCVCLVVPLLATRKPQGKGRGKEGGCCCCFASLRFAGRQAGKAAKTKAQRAGLTHKDNREGAQTGKGGGGREGGRDGNGSL